MDVRAAHRWAVQMISQHGADQRLSRPRRAMEGQHQGPLGVVILKEPCHLLWNNVLGQMLSVDIFVEVPLQVCLSGNKDTWDVNSGSTCLAFSGLIPIPLLLVNKETEKWYLGKILLCSKNYTLSKFRTTSHEINVSTIYSSSVLKNHLEVLYLTYKTHYIIVRCFFFFNGQSLRMKNNCLWTVYYHRLNC